jgi:uncharacterized protein (TIGR02145 family)
MYCSLIINKLHFESPFNYFMKRITMLNIKKSLLVFFATSYLLTISLDSFSQSVGINATGAAPNNSALLDLSSTNKGFLITRVDTASITAPAFGLMTLAPLDSCLYIFTGARWKSVGGVGSDCSCVSSSASSSLFPCNGTVIPVIEVTNPLTGKTWMDRNLGASQVATSSTNVASYGDLYQWGRCSDGHEKRISTTTTTLSLTNTPGNGNFIMINSGNFDWRSGQNSNLWQGISGINNPCPTAYRIPTEAEWDAERVTWISNNQAGAFASPLKLPMAGAREYNTGILNSVSNYGGYWSSTVNGINARILFFSFGPAGVSDSYRAYGLSVRCIKN